MQVSNQKGGMQNDGCFSLPKKIVTDPGSPSCPAPQPPISSLAGARGRSSRFSKTSSSKSSISIFWPVGPSIMYVTWRPPMWGGVSRATVGPSHTGAAGQVRPRSGNPTWSSYNKKIVSPQVPSPELFKSSTKLKFARPHLGGLRTFTFEGFFRSFEGSFEDQFSNNTLKLTANR